MNEKVEIYDMRSDEFKRISVNEMQRCRVLCFKINHTMPLTKESRELLDELFEGRLTSDSFITPEFQIDLANNVNIGKHVFINHGLTMMARGGIDIEDNVMIGPNVSLLTANHDLKDHEILHYQKITIKKNAWIGANVTILPGVIVGENAVIGACSVVTKDVPDNAVVVGNPAKVVKLNG